jgi:tetratricopeptide (TPR) repeat protein
MGIKYTTPLMTSTTTDELPPGCEVPPPPGCDVPPPSCATTENASAQTNVRDTSRRFIVDSPVEVVEYPNERLSVKTYYLTPSLQSRLSDSEHYRRLLKAGDFDAALSLCRERLLSAKDARETVIWAKEAAIVENARGCPERALDRLADVSFLAQRFGGTLRGKYDNEVGRAYELLGRHLQALKLYRSARAFHSSVGAWLLFAGVDNNTARVCTSAGRPAAAFLYLDRAALIATLYADPLLLGEVLESRALAYEAQGKYREAFEAADKSVVVLSGTDEIAALEESKGTRRRLFDLMDGGQQ